MGIGAPNHRSRREIDRLQAEARKAMGDRPPLHGDVEVEIAHKSVGQPADAANIAKCITDALEKYVYRDDGQIVSLRYVRLSERERESYAIRVWLH